MTKIFVTLLGGMLQYATKLVILKKTLHNFASHITVHVIYWRRSATITVEGTGILKLLNKKLSMWLSRQKRVKYTTFEFKKAGRINSPRRIRTKLARYTIYLIRGCNKQQRLALKCVFRKNSNPFVVRRN